MTASAEADISDAHGWLSMQDSIDYAERWQDGLFEDLQRLTYHPTKFAVAPESDILALELRRMLYYGPSGRRRRGQVVYRVLYRLLNRRAITNRVPYMSYAYGMGPKSQ